MKSLLIACVSLALAVPAAQVLASSAQDPRPDRPQRPQGSQPGAGRQASPLKGLMETLEEKTSAFGTALEADDAATQIDALLLQVCDLERLSLDTKSETPRMLTRMEGAELENARLEYRTQVQGLTTALFAVELKLVAKDIKGARKAFAALEGIQKKGHEAFKPRRGARGEGGEAGPGGRQGGGNRGGGGGGE